MITPFKRPVWPPDYRSPPWGKRASIFDHIAAHVERAPPGRLSREGYVLPDEPKRDDSRMSFARGALDGAFVHHYAQTQKDDAVEVLHVALVAACKSASDDNIRALYDLMCGGSAISLVDPLLGRIRSENTPAPGRLRDIARWFTTKAADREVVKVSIVLLGLMDDTRDRGVLLILGKHDEFTQYAVRALAQASDGESALWALAQGTDGWGRISAVEHLRDTEDPAIKDWLLRHGFKNTIMYEYLACICARAGELHLALESANVDGDLFEGAVEIISALINGGPAEGLEDYEHGCAAIHHLVGQPEARFATAAHFAFLWKLKGHIGRHLSGARDLGQDWTVAGANVIIARIDQVLASRDWRAVIEEALVHGDRDAFWFASRSCERLGLDPWPHFYRRTKAGEDYWWGLMRKAGPERIDAVLALAQEKIPLDTIASGPAEHMGFGRAYASHRALDFILQDLRAHSGKGWDFVQAGLKSPVIRNRNMAIQVLEAWGKAAWPEGAELLVRRGFAEEPNDKVKARFADVLARRDTR
ncbi:hypothetical protein [Gymnodinialimonas sp.]